jgi:CheY-like chemotaxis protein
MNYSAPVTGSIVLVDDDQEDAMILRHAVRRCSHEIPIMHLSAGQDLLAAIRESRLPAGCVVLLDLNMPTMDGFTVLEQLRSTDGHQLLPVVIYSTSSDQVQIDRAYACGANAFLTKPGSMVETFALLDAIIGHWFIHGKTPSHPILPGGEACPRP